MDRGQMTDDWNTAHPNPNQVGCHLIKELFTIYEMKLFIELKKLRYEFFLLYYNILNKKLK